MTDAVTAAPRTDATVWPPARTDRHEVHALDDFYMCSAHDCDFTTWSLTEVAHHVVTRQYPAR